MGNTVILFLSTRIGMEQGIILSYRHVTIKMVWCGEKSSKGPEFNKNAEAPSRIGMLSFIN
jgi:L,D-peptidoglycan transpeptidase YkuD (ErfK/YbiS/YcfS/YnhG family)